MPNLAKAKKMRSIAQASETLANFSEKVEVKVDQLKESIADAIKNVQNLDDNIVVLITDNGDSTEGQIMKEIEDAGKVREHTRKTLKN